MADETVGPYSPIVSIRRGRNQLPDEDRALQEAKRRLQRKGYGGGEGRGSGSGGGAGEGHEGIRDDVSVLGIPKEEMTESVRNAIDLLLDEIQHLRAELVHARSHEAYLEEQAEKDRLLHVMRRRAFLARINLAARHVEEEQVQYSFIYVAIGNTGAVRAEFGHGAAENLMMQASEVLRDEAEAGDVVGSLEQFDFGVLLPGTPRDEAVSRGHALMRALGGRSFMWQGQDVHIVPAFGVTEVAAVDSGDEVIDRAKRDYGERKAAAEAEAAPSAD